MLEYLEMKTYTFRADGAVAMKLDGKPNITRYVVGLIREDIQSGATKPIVEGVVAALLEHEVFISELASRLALPSRTRTVPPEQNSVHVTAAPRLNANRVPGGSSLKIAAPGHGSGLMALQEVAGDEAVDMNNEQTCCGKAKPCKHWSYDNLSAVWVNQLSGRKLEVM